MCSVEEGLLRTTLDVLFQQMMWFFSLLSQIRREACIQGLCFLRGNLVYLLGQGPNSPPSGTHYICILTL